MIKEVRVVPDDAKLYCPDDIPAFVEKYKSRTAAKPRVRRHDLVKGMVVVVLEGVFASKRVVYLKKLDNNLALCTGPKSINGVPLFKIDERYLLATLTVLDIGTNISVDEKNVFLSKRDDHSAPMDADVDAEKETDAAVAKAVKNVEFMKAYLSEPFEIDSSKNFYSLKH